MSSTPYIPKAESLPDRCARYFRRLPDEELSIADIALKFTVDASSVHTNLKLAVERGLLARDGQIYSAGEHINQSGESPAVTRSPFTAAASTTPRPRRQSAPHAAIDIEALQVDDDVPVISATLKGRSKWEPLFAKLIKPGQSIEVPRPISAAIAAAMHKRHKDHPQRFRVANTGPNTARVWRTA